MFDHIVGLLLIGLGIKTPAFPVGNVQGDTTEVQTVNQVQNQENKKDTEAILKDKLDLRNALPEKAAKEAASDKKAVPVDKVSRPGDLKNLVKETVDKRQATRQEFQAEIKERREQAKTAFEEQREAFKKRLETIRDQKKKSIVEKADLRLSEINTNRTNKMSEHVGKIEETILKINEKLTELSAQGKDTSTVQSKLSQAQTMVTAARSLIAAQASKEYIIGVTTESNLGQDVSRALQALEKDLSVIHESIVSLRATVQAAVKDMALLYEGERAQ